MTPGTIVDILPDTDGSNFANPKSWTVVGPTRHPYAMVVREPNHGTTVHVMVERLVVAEVPVWTEFTYGTTPHADTIAVGAAGGGVMDYRELSGGEVFRFYGHNGPGVRCYVKLSASRFKSLGDPDEAWVRANPRAQVVRCEDVDPLPVVDGVVQPLTLVGRDVTLNGRKATITGSRCAFGRVVALPDGESYEWSWSAIARIVAAGGRFVS